MSGADGPQRNGRVVAQTEPSAVRFLPAPSPPRIAPNAGLLAWAPRHRGDLSGARKANCRRAIERRAGRVHQLTGAPSAFIGGTDCWVVPSFGPSGMFWRIWLLSTGALHVFELSSHFPPLSRQQ